MIVNSCLDSATFRVFWDVQDKAAEEYDADIQTRGGAGEFTYQVGTERVRPGGDDPATEQGFIYGTANLHKNSTLTLRVRARFDPEDWSTWSEPVKLHCFETDSQEQASTAQQAEADNSPATGQPTITGRAEVGETLTASTGAIADPDGLVPTAFSYQWSRHDGSTITDISTATAATYTLQNDDLDRQVSVTISFTDDDGNQESVTSDSVYIQPPSPLYGGFDSATLPNRHDGDSAFDFQVHFSEEPELGFAAVRDHVLDVAGGEVTQVSRATQGSNIRWNITVEPDGNDDVTISLPATTDCNDDGAVCTSSSKMLSNSASAIVPGPAENSQQVQAENTPASGQPAISGTAQVGETLTADTSDISDDNGLDNAAFSYQWQRADSDISGATSATYTVASEDAGNELTVKASFTDDDGFSESLTSAAVSIPSESRSATPPNSPAAGQPTVSGTAEVGQTVSASAGGISDDNGLDNATFSYQWERSGTDIAGASGSTYTILYPDANQSLRVRVSFEDDDGYAEQVLSTATAVPEPAPLTAAFDSDTVPSEHDGENTFTLGLEFSAEPALGYAALRDHVIDAANGDVTQVSRTTQGSNIRWQLTVQPDGDDDVTISVAATTDCADQGAVCTQYGQPLASGASVTVNGPAEEEEQQQQQPSNDLPPAPTDLTGTPNADGSITLTWTAPEDDSVTSYQVLRRRPEWGETQMEVYVDDTGSTETSYTDTNTSEYTRYVYRVKARNAAGLSEWSNFVRVDKVRADE